MNFSPILKKLKKRIIDFPNRTLYFTFIGLIFLGFILAFLVFYLYIWNSPSPAIIETKQTKLNAELYQKIKAGLDQREKNIEEGLQKQLPDPFR